MNRMKDIPKLDGAGPAIRKLREAAGLSLSEMARQLGWDKGRLSKYENGHLALAASVIEEIARALKQRPEVVVLYCLKYRYPKLSLAGSEIGEALDTLVEELGKFQE